MKASAMDGTPGEDSTSQASDEQLVTLQIYVPELVVQKCMHFNREELIWDVKNQILAALPKELKEGFNYGLFCPPVNGRAGKFLDEERPLMDYPFTESTTYVELRYKRRIYKMAMEEKQLKQLHSRANLRRLIDHVNNSHVEKITKMCSRGLDPNFHCPETGESPLTLATGLKHPAKVIMALVNGGAHLDFRTKDGCTVLHKAVEKNNLEALRTLLDLGSSPNYKDARGLTTLYYSVLYNSDPQLTEMLLHDHAMIGTADPHGWQEVHQACKYGLVQHLEHLLFYGADMNARNASGNTPLHVCAVNDQESCARVLLFRGADKNALNYANQNPHQVAVIAGNLRLADIIKNHKPEDVVPYRETPRYNPRRRTSTANTGGMSQNHSDPRLELSAGGKPPSPCPSNHSLPHLSSGSDGAIQNVANDEEQDDSGVTGPSFAAATTTTTTVATTADSSDVSCVGANSSGTDSDPFDSAKSTPLLESVCICVEEYNPSTSGHLQLSKGDLVEVLAVSGSGYLEGRRRDGEEGLFPASCIQEMTMRCADTLPPSARYRADGRKNLSTKSGDMPRKWRMFGEPRTVVLHKGKKGFGFILRGAKATSPLMERQPTEFWPSLQYLDDVDKGGVAEMAGLKKGDFLLEINGQDVSQASHEHVVAIIRQSGDLVSMTVVTVIQQPASLPPTDKTQLLNRQCATLPRKLSTKKAPLPPKRDPKTTLSVGRARARSMVAGLAEIEVLDHTLNEYDSEGRSTKSSSIESIPNKPSAGATPDSTPSTTTTTPIIATTTTPTSATIQSSGRTRPGSRQVSATELEDFFARHFNNVDHLHCGPIRNKYATIARIHRMKRSKKSSFSHPIRDDTDFRIPKNYSSTPELTMQDPEWAKQSYLVNDPARKRSRSVGDVHHLAHSRHCVRRGHASEGHKKDRALHRQHSIPEASRLHSESGKGRERSSTPELQRPSIIKQNGSDIYAETMPFVAKGPEKGPRASCPPPSYPPPPPPVGQMIKVDVSRGEYANATLGRQHKSTAIMSSFRPTDSAKLYASPDAVSTVGYKRENVQVCDVTLPRHLAKGANLRSQSLPPKMPQNAKAGAEGGGRSTASLDTDYSSGDSATGYAPTFKPVQRSREPTTVDQTHPPDKRGTLRKVKTTGAKLPLGVSESSSPKNYSSHEHFIPEPGYDSSEEEETTTVLDSKSGLVTFKAVDNQPISKDKPKESDGSKESQKEDAAKKKEVTSADDKSQLTTKSKKTNHEGRPKIPETDLEKAEPKSKETTKAEDSSVVLSQETGEKIFLKPDRASDAGSASGETAANENKDSGKPQKIPPAPPPKKTEDHVGKKQTETQNEQQHEKSPRLSDLQRDGKEGAKRQTSESSGKQKESVPFKATIILKQTEVIHKDGKDTKSRGRELTHQHSAHELIHNLEANLKPKVEETPREDVKTLIQKIKSPPQTLQKPSKKDSVDVSPPRDSANDPGAKPDAAGSQKVAPAVPKKPKVDEIKAVEDSTNEASQEGKKLQEPGTSEQQDDVSPSVEMSSRSVKENIYNFEKQSQQASVKTNFSPRRKSDVIRITLVGSQHKSNDSSDSAQMVVQTMKTSKSCPKTFDDDDNDVSEAASIAALLASDTDSQVTRFSAETPTSAKDFDDWKRPGVVSPISIPHHLENIIKKPPEAPTKTAPSTTIRKPDARESVLVCRASSSNIEAETTEAQPVSSAPVKHTVPKSIPTTTQVPADLASTVMHAVSTRSTGLFSHQTLQAQVPQPQRHPVPVSQNAGHVVLTPTSRPPMSIAVTMIPSSMHQPNASNPPHSAHISAGTLSYTIRPPATSIPLVGLSQPPTVPPHSAAYMMAGSGSHHPEHRRHDSEQLIDAPRGKIVQDHPLHYVDSTSQPMRVPSGHVPVQSRQPDMRHHGGPHPASRMPAPKCREDDVCLRLCEQVDKSLQLIRLQVDSLGMAAANEPEVLTELVPPPPEFNFAPPQQGRPPAHGHQAPQHHHQQPQPHHMQHPPGVGPTQNAPIHIAPPPEFSDESLARQRRSHNPQSVMRQVPQHRMAAPPHTMDPSMGRRTVPSDVAGYPYLDHAYKGHVQQSPQDPRAMTMHHPHHQQHHMPNNLTSSPVKTMTMTRSGYPPHSLPQQQTRYDTNCSTLPHPGARMVMLPPQPHQQQQHQQQQQQQHQHQHGQHSQQRSDRPFSPGRNTRDDSQMLANIPPPPQPQKEFRQKPLHLWNMKDVSDWLESLFLPEYKICFAEAGITGSKLANMDNNDLMGLGVKQAGHRLNMERSIKWYLK